jgi:hypothetical protein
MASRRGGVFGEVAVLGGMMDSPSDEEIIAELSACSPSRLIRVLTPILAAHSKRDPVGSRLALCEFYSADDTSGGEREWVVSLISAPVIPEEWTAFDQQGYWESGSCERCKMEVSSYAKCAPCPLCGSSIEMT